MTQQTIRQFKEKYESLAGKVHLANTITEAATILISICREVHAERIALAGFPEDLEKLIVQQCTQEDIVVLTPPFARSALPLAIDTVQVGISLAAFGIATTGTLVEMTADDTIRLISTLPRVHVGIIRAEDLVETLAEAAPRIRYFFRQHPCNGVVTFISGPSRTGDIEMQLTLGVHGPEIAHAIVLHG